MTSARTWIAVATLVVAGPSWSAVLVADNNSNAPTGAHIHATLQDAIDAASDGDIVHVVPSATNYGSVSVNKQLHLVGIGVNPDKDLVELSEVEDITLIRDGTGNAAGTIIEGLEFNSSGGVFYVSPSLPIDNITIRKCRFLTTGQAMNIDDATAVLVEHCIITGYLSLEDADNQDIVVRNNMFYGTGRVYGVKNGVITNNIFVDFQNGTDVVISITDSSLITNNIIFGNLTGDANNDVDIYNNNLVYLPGTSAGNENLPPDQARDTIGQDNIDGQDPLFTFFPAAGTSTVDFDHDFHLQAGSPGEDAGTDGTDLGIYGGVSPFDLEPSIPIIQQLNTSALVQEDADLTVTVRAKAQ